ncbi:MAG: cupin domain-containing protein [Deltaproteobacteria bacterium]|nr:cupin domain-containing protein [Deltaproteobacteria bacterium]
MPVKINQPTFVEAAGNKFKSIEEYVGRLNSRTSEASIARVVSPPGWIEPGQKTDFTECTLVLKGVLRVQTGSEEFIIHENEAIVVNAGEWVQYSTPGDDGAEYISVCVPAFAQNSVHRDE